MPLNAILKPLDTSPTRARYALRYDSTHDQRVPALLSIPRGFRAPYPAILLMHGSGGSKSADYILACSEAMTAQGYATISIDAQYLGDRKRPGRSGDIRPDSFTSRDAWVQTVIDQRRAVDYLQSRPDIDRSRIGYLGFSMGGMLGSILGGVEDRISCFCLAVPGGGFVQLAENVDKYPMLKARWPITVTPEVLARVAAIANVIDPIYFVGRILPRPLLILVGTYDELIPPAATNALIEAAHARPENIERVASGHVLNPAVIFDIRRFFTAHLQRPPHAAGR
jgi:dienelactone hydrolase